MNTLLLQRTFLVLFIFILSIGVKAQLPECDKYYRMFSNGSFETVDPATNTVTMNSISTPSGSSGLAVAENFFSATPSPTFYTLKNSRYYYYDGNNWVDTGHSAGHSAAVNPGGAGAYIYNLDGLNARLYRYDGTGPSTLFLNLGSFSGPFDVMGDSEGNVYVLYTGGTQALRMYDVNGDLACSYDLVNMPQSNLGGGYSIVNGILYATTGAGVFEGVISGTTITFTNTGSTSHADYANCAFPPINLTIATPDDLTCSTTSVQLSSSTSITNPTYSWSGPGIVSGGNTANPIVDAPGTYTLTVTSGGGGCAGTSVQEVVVNQTGGLGLNISPSDATLCEGESSILTVTASAGTAPYTYTWDNGLPPGNSNSVSPTSTTTYTATVTDDLDCSSTISSTITVSQTPAINAGTDQTICDGGQVTLNASGAGTNGTYSWDNGVSDGVAFTPNSGTTTYTVTGTNANGCENTDQVNVSVGSLPTVDAGADQIVCEGNQLTLTGSGVGTGGTYTWDNGVSDGVPFIPDPAITTYTLTGTNASGCQDTDQIDITVLPGVIPSFAGDELKGCTPHTVNFTNNSNAIGTICTWSFGDGSTETGCNTVSHTYSTSGIYDVTLTVETANGCTGTHSETNYIEVLETPIASFTANPTVVGIGNTEVIFQNQSVDGDNYTWNFGDGSPEEHSFNAAHTFPSEQSQNYTVTLVASNDQCTDTAQIVMEVEDNVIFYVPNAFTPDQNDANETFQPVFTSGYDPQDFEMFIYNRWGEVIFETHNAEIGWDGTYAGKIAPVGIYIWKIEFKETMSDKRHYKEGHVNVLR